MCSIHLNIDYHATWRITDCEYDILENCSAQKYEEYTRNIYIFIGIYVAPTQSYGDFPALLVKEDIGCPFFVVFQAQTGTWVERQRFRKLGCTWRNPKMLSRFGPKAVRGKWFEFDDINHSATVDSKMKWPVVILHKLWHVHSAVF
jgi:hypothetical protein